MRFQLGFTILLVLSLGFICISPISSYNYEDSTELERSLSEPDQGERKENVEKISDERNENSQQEKRGMGMPAPLLDREKSNPPPQFGPNPREAQLSSPVNDPIELSNPPPAPENTEVRLDQANANQPSAARGITSSLLAAMGGNTNQEAPGPSLQAPTPEQVQSTLQAQPPIMPAPIEPSNIPTIIENSRAVAPDLAPPSPQQQQPPTPVLEQPQNLPPQMTGPPPPSTARTFDGWTNCMGSSSNKYGTCKNDVECSKNKGRAEGSCMGGLGVCCVMALSCGEKSLENNTFYANPDFPEPSWEARLCEVELKKKHSKVLQIMIEFEEFELAPPNPQGECITDVFQIKLASNRPSPYSLLRICGQNTGQHMYLDVSQIDEPLVLSVATSGGGFPRRWSIRIVQMDEKNFLLAPAGCLQYYTDTVGHFRSFNLGRNLRNLYYAICFRIDNGYSGIRFTENFFGMNGPFCRKKQGGGQIGGGRYNGTFGAHPHHLVIPPLGYPIAKPKFALQVGVQAGIQKGQVRSQGRFKRLAYSEPYERVQRTHHEHDHDHLHESEKFEEKGHQHEYPSYGPPVQNYGAPPLLKAGYPPEYKDEKLHGEVAKVSSWKDAFGWATKEELKHDDKLVKYPYKSYPHAQGYGPQPYGYQGYGPPGYGKYYHKEIDKFGQKYEHLEYKHEKNHHHKEHEKTSSGWWPWGGSKKDEHQDKKEKYFLHHEALFPMMHIPEMPYCEPRFCGQNDVITFPPSGDSISEMCGNRFNRGRGPKIISGSPLVVYVSNRGVQRGAGFDVNYEQVFYIPRPY